uniref:Uncharacterized protein n=1 Tax=Lepeophtheirus salmonis TaxID=72036 RepID=A0A0K2TFQ2_LEPSM
MLEDFISRYGKYLKVVKGHKFPTPRLEQCFLPWA